MSRRVGLRGHQFDLENLADGFSDGDPTIVHDDGAYFLESSEFDSFASRHVDLIERARELLTQMNGAALLVDGRHRPVELDGTIHDPGGNKHAVVVAGVAEARGKVYSPSVSMGDPAAPSGPTAARVALTGAVKTGSAEAVLRLLGQGPHDWTNLYRVVDYVAHECGGKSGIVKKGLASDDEIDRFGASANRVEVSGDDARHGPMRGAAPTRTMALEEAQTFVRRLVLDWIRTL